jgi:hypothetical protein
VERGVLPFERHDRLYQKYLALKKACRRKAQAASFAQSPLKSCKNRRRRNASSSLCSQHSRVKAGSQKTMSGQAQNLRKR